MPSIAELLLDLVSYVRTLQPGSQVATELVDDDLLLTHTDAVNLPGVKVSPSRDIWLQANRLEASPPPQPPEDIASCLVGPLDLADARPQVAPSPSDQSLFPEAPGTMQSPISGRSSLSGRAEQWLVEKWDPWAEKSAPLQASNAFYQALFREMTHLKLEGGAETDEVVFGFGTMAWATPSGVSLRIPMFVQACELVMESDDGGALQVRPAASLPESPFAVLGHAKIKTTPLARKWLDEQEVNLSDLDPSSQELLRELVSGVARHLDPNMTLVDHASVTGHLQVDLSWRLYRRTRPNDRLRRDLDAFEQVLSDPSQGASIPGFMRAIVDETAKAPPSPRIAWRGSEPIGLPGPDTEVRDLFFPLPYNDEQAQVIGHLASSDGAIVQGPPGTGKSHTIANVISHYLAHGKRVLVAASSADALGVVREKIPARIRDLSAALLSSDTTSLAEFERSIMEIEYNLANLDHVHAAERIRQLEALLSELHERIAIIDRDLEKQVAGHRQWHDVAGERLSSQDVARQWRQHRPHDGATLPSPVPAALSQDVRSAIELARQYRRTLGALLADPALQGRLPEELPDPEQAKRASLARQSIGEIEKAHKSGMAWPVIHSTPADRVAAERALVDAYNQVVKASDERTDFLSKVDPQWVQGLDHAAGLDINDPVTARLMAMVEPLEACHHRLRALDGRVDIKSTSWLGDDEVTRQAREALARLSKGEPAFAWWQAPLRKQASARLDEVLFDGAKPASTEQWAQVCQRVEDIHQARRLYNQWCSLCKAIGLPRISARNTTISRLVALVLQAARQCANANVLQGELYPRWSGCLQDLFGDIAFQDDVPRAQEQALRSLRQHERFEQENEVLDRWALQLSNLAATGPFGQRLAARAPATTNQEDDAGYWLEAQQERNRLAQAQETAAGLRECVSIASAAGLEAWAAQWHTPLQDNMDHVIPEDWAQRWRWQVLDQVIHHLGESGNIDGLLDSRKDCVLRLNECIQELVAARSWMGASQSASPQVRRALKDYALAVRRQGSGKGKRANRQRANARAAMQHAFAAIPCWIMPHGRVSESLPSELGVFDLVIIDEASQSDIQALPTLLRGKQLLIVGDDKQVSPAAVGVSEQRMERFLAGPLARQPYKHLLLPERSLYDLFGVVFSGRDIMLREHFRSVEPIIAYSNRHYYHDKIVPLRIPDSTARLDPPLIDVLVRDGVYQNGVNEGEARWIADEIERLLADPQMDGRSIGVVTLTSNTRQAATIHRELASRDIGMDAWLSRGLAVGPPPSFQGKERDIMFVSMVWDGRNPRQYAANNQGFQQRFNVALSRARDRTYLVRSNEGRPFPPDSLLSQVIEHFQSPLQRVSQDAPDRTGFPALLAEHLRHHGYRVSTDPNLVPDGVDIVVEGTAGQRLAIACDGHQVPGMEKPWSDDIRRQRTLERAGWRVWRGFVCHFERDQDDFMQGLFGALSRNGINPVDGDATLPLRLTEHRLVGESPTDLEGNPASPINDSEDWPVNPSQWPQDRQDLLAMCESPLEEGVLGALLDRDYRVRPQYPAGPYRIDMLVHGPDGKRLAIECDGEKYHGVDKQDEDRARQVWLEDREGLVFWRCWGSDWFSDRARCLEDLLDALRRAGVMPWSGE